MHTSHPMLRAIMRATLIAGAVAVVAAGCSDPVSPGPETEEVLPNYVTLTLTNSANALDVVRATFSDPDGLGGTAGTSDTLRVAAGANYKGEIAAEFRGKLPGSTRDTVIDLTAEYEELGTEHQFFYTLSGPDASRIAIVITDKDSGNLPLGVQTDVGVSAGAAGGGSLRVELGHYDDPARPKNGTLTPYERDIDVTFPVLIW